MIYVSTKKFIENLIQNYFMIISFQKWVFINDIIAC
jgi:hypothetical protein